MIPQSILITPYNINIQTILIFAALGLFVALFTIWNESRKDGFDYAHAFDLFAITTLLAGLFYKTLSVLIDTFNFYSNFLTLHDIDIEMYKILFVLVTYGLILYFIAKRLRWSVYRILDIYALASLVFLTILSFGFFALSLPSLNQTYIVITFLLSLAILGLQKTRNRHLNSGWVFSLTLLLYTFTGVLYFRKLGYLIFYLFLIIISSVNLYLREQNQMLNTNFLSALKKRLMFKNKRIKAEQKLLMEEDPYLNDRDRTTGNAEVIDEAILEDETKNLIDTKQTFMAAMQVQVSKALAKMRLGKYGLCDTCGKRIDPARLKAYPVATTCMTCASKDANR